MSKAISLRNPFANLVSMGIKTIETRVASSPVAKTQYRGEIYMCVSGQPHLQWQFIKQHYLYSMNHVPLDPFLKMGINPIWESLEGHPNRWERFSEILLLPIKTPSIVAIVNLVSIKRMIESDQENACYSLFDKGVSIQLDNIRPIQPIPLIGKTNGFHLGIFDVDLNPDEIIYINQYERRKN